jgi:hypothetical protein
MKIAFSFGLVASAAVLFAGSCLDVQAQQQPPQSPNMTFFVISVGPGKGADLGGLEGADRHCQTLAQAVGAGGKTWRAYLSTQAVGGAQAINARDRIGHGPWQNFKAEVVAQSVDDLHSENNKLGMQTSLTERGTIIPGVGYAPNRHDVLTGSQTDGRAFPSGEDRTCRNWTSGTQGAAMVGHIDRKGLRDDAASRSWNSSHPSRGPDGGCSQADLRSTGGRRRAILLLRRSIGGFVSLTTLVTGAQADSHTAGVAPTGPVLLKYLVGRARSAFSMHNRAIHFTRMDRVRVSWVPGKEELCPAPFNLRWNGIRCAAKMESVARTNLRT